MFDGLIDFPKQYEFSRTKSLSPFGKTGEAFCVSVSCGIDVVPCGGLYPRHRMDVNVHAIHTKPTGSRLVRLSGLCKNSPTVQRRVNSVRGDGREVMCFYVPWHGRVTCGGL